HCCRPAYVGLRSAAAVWRINACARVRSRYGRSTCQHSPPSGLAFAARLPLRPTLRFVGFDRVAYRLEPCSSGEFLSTAEDVGGAPNQNGANQNTLTLKIWSERGDLNSRPPVSQSPR